MRRIVVNINVIILMGKISSPLKSFTNKKGVLGCEFDIQTKMYTESRSKATTVTCVVEGKQAELILDQKTTGDTIIITGYLGEGGDISAGKCAFGRHKVRITRVHIEYLNYVFMGGKIVTKPIYNESRSTTEFYIQTERYLGSKQLCRMRVICSGYIAQLVRAFKDMNGTGGYIDVMGLLSQEKSEHVVYPSRVELLIPEEEKSSVMKKLREESEKKNAKRSKATNPVPGRDSDNGERATSKGDDNKV